MRRLSLIALLLGLAGCAAPAAINGGSGSGSANRPLAAAERVIDAFYSFEPRQLRAALADAPDSQPRIMFYQGWAQGGNYAVLVRKPCAYASASEVTCAITVRDDLIVALGTGYWVTDTFHLTVQDGRIVKVRTSSNDPPDFELALNWLQREQPEVMSGPCQGFFAGGPTPGDCVRAVVKGFAAYRDSR